MLRRLIIFGILILSAQLVFAQGTTGFEIMRSEVSGRGAGMAGALIAVESGVDGLFYNPAALGGMDYRQADLSYLSHLLDIDSGFLAYGQPLKDYGVLGVGINYINYGNFEEATAYGELTGNKFKANDLLFTLGYGRKMVEWLSLGLSIKYVRSEIWNVTASGVGFDVGALIYTPFDGTKIGAGVFNMGRSLDGFYDYKDKLPMGYKLGVSKPLAHLPLEIALQLEKYQDSQIYFSAGGEFTISELLRLRFGWSTKGVDQKVEGDKDIFAGASLGAGLWVSNVFFDYAVTSWGNLGTLIRITVGGVF